MCQKTGVGLKTGMGQKTGMGKKMVWTRKLMWAAVIHKLIPAGIAIQVNVNILKLQALFTNKHC